MRRAGDVQRRQPVVAADAVFLVHDQVALGDFGGLGDELVGPLAAARGAGDAVAQQVLLAHHREAVGDEAALDAQRHQRDGAGRLAVDRLPIVFLRRAEDAVLAQQVRQAFARAARPGGDDDPPALAGPALGLRAKLLEDVEADRAAAGRRPAVAWAKIGPGPAAAIDPHRPVGPGERREREQRPAAEHRVPAGAVEIQPVRRQRPVRHLAVARDGAAGGVVVVDHLQPGGQHLLGLVVQADRGARQVVQQRLHALVEQRHPVLHAGMAAAVGDRLVHRVVGGAAGSNSSRQAERKRAIDVAVERHLGDRAQRQAPRLAPLRWVAGSNTRIDSMVSPNRSSRTGSGSPAGNRSMMPPRMAYSPGSITVPARP